MKFCLGTMDPKTSPPDYYGLHWSCLIPRDPPEKCKSLKKAIFKTMFPDYMMSFQTVPSLLGHRRNAVSARWDHSFGRRLLQQEQDRTVSTTGQSMAGTARQRLQRRLTSAAFPGRSQIASYLQGQFPWVPSLRATQMRQYFLSNPPSILKYRKTRSYELWEEPTANQSQRYYFITKLIKYLN